MSTRRANVVRLESDLVRLQDGDYRGLVVSVERGPALWGLRKLARWEQDEQRERRADWHAYYHVRLHEGETPALHGALRDWATANGKLPVVWHACRYACRKGSSTPLPIRSSASNLFRLLVMTRPGTTMIGQDIDFSSPVGWGLSVRLRTKTIDWQQDPLPESLQRSIISKVLSAFPAPQEWVANSMQWAVGSREQHSTPIDGRFREVNGVPPASLTSSRRGQGEHVGGKTTAVVQDESDRAACTTADDDRGLVAPYVPPPALSEQARSARIRRRFGPHPDLAPRGPCRWCSEPTLGRPGEGGWCARCDG